MGIELKLKRTYILNNFVRIVAVLVLKLFNIWYDEIDATLYKYEKLFFFAFSKVKFIKQAKCLTVLNNEISNWMVIFLLDETSTFLPHISTFLRNKSFW